MYCGLNADEFNKNSTCKNAKDLAYSWSHS